MQTPNSHIFNYKNTNIYFTDKGKGSTIVFLHGFLENRSMWEVVADKIAEKHRTIAIDLLGHGASECLGYIHTMEEQADMILTLITSLKLRKVTLVGHSMGGYIALAFAELYPDYVKGLALINSTSRADSELRKANRDRAITAVKKNADLFIRLAVSNLFAEAVNIQGSIIEEIVKTAQRTPTQGVIAAIEGMKIRPDREVLLHFGPYPKLMIAGIKDTIVSIDEVKDQVNGTDVHLEIIDCGHMAVVEQPQKIIDILQNFLKGL